MLGRREKSACHKWDWIGARASQGAAPSSEQHAERAVRLTLQLHWCGRSIVPSDSLTWTTTLPLACTHAYTRMCMHVLQTSATAASPRLSVPHQLLAPIWLYEVSAVMTVTCPVRITNGQSPWGACPVTTVEIPVHTCVFVFVCLHPCVCVCVCVCFCACVYIHTFIRTYVRTYIHTYIHTYI